ncbi:MAG: translation initiation factor IF-2 [Dehalococcoidia bacterium]|nr:translation initiation factor IF-2 [Dehalococcoidia bacterium]
MSTQTPPQTTQEPEERRVQLPRALTVKELGDTLGTSAIEVIKELMKNGVMASINQVIDFDTAAIVATDLGFEVEEEAQTAAEEAAPEATTSRRIVDETATTPRPPVVTVLGHVDHGKTSLLDAIRRTKVAEGEAGGITQHIGAYQVDVQGRLITFLDTPGHEAFTSMRARGAQVTDLAILVVAADDGVMPQTVEAINHARAADVAIVVALNKIDAGNANPDRVKQQLLNSGLVLEELGGDVICVPVSARTGEGLDSLLENLLIATEVLELKANPDRAAVGVVIESELDVQRGPIATILVQTGTLRAGDAVVVGQTWGKIKAMFDDRGARVTEAEPSKPVVVMGLQEVPVAGDRLIVAPDERTARAEVSSGRREREADAFRDQRSISLDTLFGEISAGKMKEFNIVLKTDVQGSIEPIRNSLERLTNQQVRVKIIHTGTGPITESDVLLAAASRGMIIGFNSRPDEAARRLADVEKVDIRHYSIIYKLIEDIEAALKGMLEPVFEEIIDGHAEVRQVFKIGRKGNIAGSYVRDGDAPRGSLVRVTRKGEKVFEGRIASLKRFQEDVREVATGFECGIALEGFEEFQEGDVLEFFHSQRVNT